MQHRIACGCRGGHGGATALTESPNAHFWEQHSEKRLGQDRLVVEKGALGKPKICNTDLGPVQMISNVAAVVLVLVSVGGTQQL